MSDPGEKKKGKGLSPVANTVIFVLFVLVVIGLLTAISGERSPRVPIDAIHNGIEDNAVCLECHGPGMAQERGPKHPPKDQCLLCHHRKRVPKGE